MLIRGYSLGGHSLSSDAQYLSASMASGIVSEMGSGNFSQIELGKALAGKVARMRAYISELSEGVSGSASPSDIESQVASSMAITAVSRLLQARAALASSATIATQRSRKKNGS